MKLLLIALFIAVVCAEDMHTTLNDNHDFKKVVEDPKLLEEHTMCYLGTGPCDELLDSFQKNMYDAIQERCARCNPDQMNMFITLLRGMEKNRPDLFKKYSEKYDPAGDKMKPIMEYMDQFYRP